AAIASQRRAPHEEVYRGPGVREVWVFRNEAFEVMTLAGAQYEAIERSQIFPEATSPRSRATPCKKTSTPRSRRFATSCGRSDQFPVARQVRGLTATTVTLRQLTREFTFCPGAGPAILRRDDFVASALPRGRGSYHGRLLFLQQSPGPEP